MPSQFLELELDALIPDPAQPRQTFPEEELQRLATSLASRGVLAPLRVRRDEDRASYILIAGECRWRAARLAGLNTVPCVVVEGALDDGDILVDQVTENVARNALKPSELARAIAKLKALKGWSSQDVAAEVGMSGASISRAESLLTLPPPILELVDAERIPESVAAEIARLPDEESRFQLATAVVEGRMRRPEVVAAVQARVGKRSTTPKSSRVSCKVNGRMTVTMLADQPLSWPALI